MTAWTPAHSDEAGASFTGPARPGDRGGLWREVAVYLEFWSIARAATLPIPPDHEQTVDVRFC